MKRFICMPLLVIALAFSQAQAGTGFEKDLIKTSAGDLEVTFVGHGSLLMTFNGQVIYVDPFSKLADYSKMPKADLVLLTHHHRDHLDPEAIKHIRNDRMEILVTDTCAKELTGGGRAMRNGETAIRLGMIIEAVPAYNLIHKRDNGSFFHPKGEGNGYILTFGDTRVYVAGDTENTPEMKAMKDIDYAFLPMNLPYTMTPEMVADAAKSFRPKVLYPYHYGDTDTTQLTALLRDEKDIEVRIRKMK